MEYRITTSKRELIKNYKAVSDKAIIIAKCRTLGHQVASLTSLVLFFPQSIQLAQSCAIHLKLMLLSILLALALVGPECASPHDCRAKSARCMFTSSREHSIGPTRPVGLWNISLCQQLLERIASCIEGLRGFDGDEIAPIRPFNADRAPWSG